MKLFSAGDEYAKLSAADIKRVAQKYFGEKNRTVGTLIPEANASAPAN
jgi:hypothetical protein